MLCFRFIHMSPQHYHKFMINSKFSSCFNLCSDT